MESNTEDYNNFFVHFEEVTGHDFEYSLWSWERKLLPVFFVWEDFEIEYAGTKYFFMKGDRFNPYRFSYDKFKSIYKSGLVGTTTEKPGITKSQIWLSAVFLLMVAFGFLGLMVFFFNEWACIVSAVVGIVGFLAVNYEY